MIKIISHYTYWLLIFGMGIFQLLGLDSFFYKVGIPFVAGVLLGMQLVTTNKRLELPFIEWFIAFIVISVLSATINGIDYFSLILFLIYTTLSYFYFVVLINETDLLLLRRVISLVRILIIIQIPAIFIKFFSLGQSEAGAIGTLATTGGSISTIFPLFVIAILFSFYLYEEKTKYLIAIACFCLFGIIGSKRAIIFFIPLILSFTYFLFIKLRGRLLWNKIAKKVLLLIGISVCVFYFISKTNPSLNPEHSKWGSFDFMYVMKYTAHYTSSEGKEKKEMRRKDGLIYFINYVFSQDGPTMILGEGAGKLVQSKYNSRSATMSDEYGIRYGGRMGFIWLLLQVGFLGTLAYLLFFVRAYFYVLKNYESHPLYLSFLVLTFVFFLDTITYSNVFIRYEFLKGVYFGVLALIYLDRKYRFITHGNADTDSLLNSYTC